MEDEEVYIEFKNGQGPYLSDTQINQMQKLIKGDIKEKKENLEAEIGELQTKIDNVLDPEIEALQTKIDGVQVYSNSTGTTSNFTISQNLDNVSKIRVHYTAKNSAFQNEIYEIKEIPVVNGKANSSLDALYSGSINLWIMRTEISISGTEVSLTNNIVNVLGEEVSVRQEASIYITKIVAI